jgi:hypothetical protein
MRNIGILCLLFILALVSCKKEDATGETPVGSRITAAGFGPSTAAFAGPSWQLPQGIELIDSIHEGSWWVDVHGGTEIPFRDRFGTPGGLFPICFYLRNTTGQPITITFPRELLIQSGIITTQNGIIFFLEPVTIAPNAEAVVMASAYCLNLGRSVPSLHDGQGNLQTYTFGPTNVPSQLKEITEILKNKNVTHRTMLKPNGSIDLDQLFKVSKIQAAVWEATDEEGLTAETKADLQNF